MGTAIQKKSDWYDKFELAGIVFQVIVAFMVLLILAAMTTKVGDVWQLFF